MRPMIIVLATMALLACGAMPGWPGYISTNKSAFDGSTRISVQPGPASGCCLLGANWSTAAPDYVQIVAVSTGGYVDIASAGGVEFNIDGRVVRLDSTPHPTQTETVVTHAAVYRSSSKVFIMRRADFNSMLSAKLLRVRLNTASGSIDGDLLRDVMPGAAIDGFRNFAAKLP